jgi:hypothetical protein
VAFSVSSTSRKATARQRRQHGRERRHTKGLESLGRKRRRPLGPALHARAGVVMQHDRDAVAEQPDVEFNTSHPGTTSATCRTGRLFSGHLR